MDANLNTYVLLARRILPAISKLDSLLTPLAYGWKDSHGEWVRPVEELDRDLRARITEAEATLALARKLLDMEAQTPVRN